MKSLKERTDLRPMDPAEQMEKYPAIWCLYLSRDQAYPIDNWIIRKDWGVLEAQYKGEIVAVIPLDRKWQIVALNRMEMLTLAELEELHKEVLASSIGTAFKLVPTVEEKESPDDGRFPGQYA